MSQAERELEGCADEANAARVPDRLSPETVERLFAEHNRALIRFLRTRVRSDQEARDVAQEAYVRLLQIDQPGTISFLRAYLFRTALISRRIGCGRRPFVMRRTRIRSSMMCPSSPIPSGWRRPGSSCGS